eukprot:COSAG05_NODE_22562_length_264_cov_0.618182_1_plen_81_part_10
MHACRIMDLNSLIQGFSTYWYTVYTYLAGYRVFRVFSTKWGTGDCGQQRSSRLGGTLAAWDALSSRSPYTSMTRRRCHSLR